MLALRTGACLASTPAMRKRTPRMAYLVQTIPLDLTMVSEEFAEWGGSAKTDVLN